MSVNVRIRNQYSLIAVGIRRILTGSLRNSNLSINAYRIRICLSIYVTNFENPFSVPIYNTSS